MAMEIIMLGVCGGAGEEERPLLMFNPSYTNYDAVGLRIGRKTVTVERELNEDGEFELPSVETVEQRIIDTKPGALLIIPYDNPTGQLFSKETLIEYTKLCVKHNLWIISDEAYRELAYEKGKETSSIWALTDKDVPGIEGRRISLETASKVWMLVASALVPSLQTINCATKNLLLNIQQTLVLIHWANISLAR